MGVKHTPEAWRRGKETEKGVWIESETRDDIAFVAIDDTDLDTFEETAANVALIEATPELYVACKALFTPGMLLTTAIDMARAAVAKAEGGNA